VLDRIARIMEPDGYLLLGAAETVVGLTTSFRPIADRRALYGPGPAPLKPAPVLSLPRPSAVARAGAR
jgi:chemotaxis protein methyltransferase CheR